MLSAFVDEVNDADVFRMVAFQNFNVRFRVFLALVELNNANASVFDFVGVHSRLAGVHSELFENIVL